MANKVSDIIYKKPGRRFGVRHFQTCMLCLGIMFINLMKVDMSLAIVAMTDSTQNNTFDWSHQRQSVILSSYKWGYVFSKVPGGELSARFGGKVVLAGCAIVNFIMSLLMPLAGVYGGWQAVCFCRLMQGLAQGAVLPTLHTLSGKWAPPEERSTLGSMLSAGSQLGIALEYAIAGVVASYWGWQAIFYVNGVILFIWTAFYLVLGAASPEDSKRIGEDERLYIQSSLGQENKQRLKTPWKALLTSVPFLVLVLTHAGNGWGYWTLLTEMPTYFNKVLGVNIKENGFLSALPYLACTIATPLFGLVTDYILSTNKIGITACRKINNTIGTFGPAAFLIAISFVTNDVTTAVAFLTTAVTLTSGCYVGYNLVHLDMAPNHAGTMVGISGFVSNVLSTFAPLAAGFFIQDETLPSEWRKVFILAAAILVLTNVIFIFFGSCEKQTWNDCSDSENTDQQLKKEKENEL